MTDEIKELTEAEQLVADGLREVDKFGDLIPIVPKPPYKKGDENWWKR